MCVKVSAGTAYVKGYDVDITGTQVLDVEKPRDKKEVPSALVPYEMGTILKVNNVFGLPAPNINEDTYCVKLHNQRIKFRMLETGEYKLDRQEFILLLCLILHILDDSTEWDLHLFDVQTFTQIVVNYQQ